MDRFALMQIFVTTVACGSFSAAARELHASQPTVSRSIAQLEEYLGVRLLHRSTRRLTLTVEGEAYHAECRRILDAVAEVETGVRGSHSARGRLRISCPSALARHRLMPVLPSFAAANPHVVLDILFDDQQTELVAEGIDIAVRLGRLRNTTHRARLVATYGLCCVASRDYLQMHGMPQTPGDLLKHNCVIHTRAADSPVWSFGGEQVRPSGNLLVDNAEGLRSAVLSHMGIVVAPTWLFADELLTGQVVSLLGDWPINAIPIYLLYPSQRFLPARARAFMDHVAHAFQNDPCFNGHAVEELGLMSCSKALREAAVTGAPLE